jgi:hypothetical protein
MSVPENLRSRTARDGRVIPRQSVRIDGTNTVVLVPEQANCPEPKIDLVRDGDVVQRIIVHCSCGQTLELQCEYDSTP